MAETDTISDQSSSTGSSAEDSASRVLGYTFGELSHTEEQEFERDLGNDETGDLGRDLGESMEALTLIAEDIASRMPAPRKALKKRVLAAVLPVATESEIELEEEVVTAPQPHIVQNAADTWITDPNLPGVFAKILYQDPVSKVYTLLARLEPGASYPPHRHVGMEQCYVVSGDLHLNSIELTAGDYIANEDGAHHQNTWTNGGCVLLLTTLLADEILL